MEWLNILIVEDETPLAEMHAEFIRQNGGCRQIWLAAPGAGARHDRAFQAGPDPAGQLSPDGRGITLLRELTLSGYRGGIVHHRRQRHGHRGRGFALRRVRLPDQTAGL